MTDFDRQELGGKFKFAVFSRFRNNEKLGHKLMSGLAQANSSQFQYELGEWTAQHVREKVDQVSQQAGGATVSNIYVCGPPNMNQEFETVLKELQASG